MPITIIPPLFASAYISLFNFISFCSTTSLSFTWNTRNNLALIGIPLVENTLQISWKSDWACSVIHRGEKLYNIVNWSDLLKLFVWTFASTTLLTLFKIDDKVNTMIFKMVGKCKVLWLNFCHSGCKDVKFVIFELLVCHRLDYIVKSNLAIIVCKLHILVLFLLF